MKDLLTTAEAARLLNLTPAAVRAMERRGAIRAEVVTGTGMRLYRRREVEALVRERATKAKGGPRG